MTSIDLDDLKHIDTVLHLPTVQLIDKRKLPPGTGLYFAISGLGEILYIGSSISIRIRWFSHHKYEKLLEMGDVRLAWSLWNSDEESLRDAEVALIRHYKPCLNGRRIWEKTRYPETLKNLHIGTSVRADQYKLITETAGKLGLSTATWLRRVCLQEIQRMKRRKRKSRLTNDSAEFVLPLSIHQEEEGSN